ncbi:GLPGLI family protein [Algoriphagus ratkowskyi]|uniref:GLPGLI family protein n=1 Tax=Algoriphagus ratkowskyi TaxID=57028 RepID=A0A2W7RHB0_9BACT|nr:GLPGLI family protein [Algoriphagus ratkowskyi]PZX59601.1 GLPGLI family protein [Algoriphagus ratkowskyi]TXD78676.1 GLPGLI family protein [Algoriphagus ratkowskyi]
MKLKYLNTLILILICTGLRAQNIVGEVEYRYRIFYDKIYSSLPHITQQEKDRILLTWSNPDGYSTRMKLQFWPEKSLYTFGEPYQVQSYSWQVKDYFIENNLEDQTYLKYMDQMGKTYIVRDSLNTPKWRVMNEIRDILGHMCMKAVSEDSIKGQKITAWFASDIPVPMGPEEQFGLPGLILAYDINDGMLIVEAEKITFGEPEEIITLPKKLKGREVSGTKYQDIVREFIQSSIDSRRAWMWEIRY